MIDLDFDCRLDAGGRDPDVHSPTLRRHHKLLWGKRLPGGRRFDLDITCRKPFLVHRSEIGEFHLTSDSIAHRYGTWARIAPFVGQLPEDLKSFVEASRWPVSECIVFPGRKINGGATVNAARGMNRKIGDRFDLTLECIRRHYCGGTSPLAEVLGRYSAFFSLFGSFEGYVDFFWLQDLVTPDYRSVRFYLPFDDFISSPIPGDVGSYVTYLKAMIGFVSGRRDRMREWCGDTLVTE